MNLLAIILIVILIIIEILLGDSVVLGIPLWLIALMIFSFIWIIIMYIKDKR